MDAQSTATQHTAAGPDFNLLSPDTYVPGVPHEAFRTLRNTAPVSWQKDPESPGFWAITKHADVVTISRDPKTFSSHRRTAMLMELPPDSLAETQLFMINADPPRHTKLRALVNKGFTPRMVARLEPHVRDIANAVIDAVAQKGECDFVTEVAAELPLQVIAEMMGVPLADRRALFSWSNRMIGQDDPEYGTTEDEAKRASLEVYMYANQLAAERRRNPGEDLMSVLLNAEVDGEKLTEMEFDVFFVLLMIAGNETTRNLISGGMLALIDHPEQRARLLKDRSLINTAVDEMLRWVSPVMAFRRTATRDTEIRGQKIREGDKVLMFYPSANRDEEVFPEADRFDVGRTPNDHLAFGIGEHFCLGSNLARLEIRVMFEELLRRLPDIELAGPVARLRSNFINGIKHMPVKFTPKAA
ncbi:MAG: cytochrome family protein [Deltaproteobacteria bacterium]|nr:cytochrome family protein [Deltaproteobacteria bacterium]